MKTVSDLEQEFSNIKSKRIPRLEKIPLVKLVRGGVQQIERKAASDFSFPLQEIRKAVSFLIILDDYLKT